VITGRDQMAGDDDGSCWPRTMLLSLRAVAARRSRPRSASSMGLWGARLTSGAPLHFNPWQ
jgi:hypothetical protein